MKKFTKKLSLLLTSLFLLESCKSKSDKITITFWNNYLDPTESNLKEEDARKNDQYNLYFYLKDIITKFENEHPNVEVKTKYFNNYYTISKQINEDSKGGTLPSMALAYPDSAKEFLNSQIPIKNMYSIMNDKNRGFGRKANSDAQFLDDDSESSYIDDASSKYDSFVKNYIDVEKGMYDDNSMYSLPYSKSGEALFVNKTVFEKEGEGKAGIDSKLPDAFGKNLNYTAPSSASSKIKYTLNDDYSFEDLINLARKIQTDYPSLYPLDKDGKPTYIDVSSGTRVFNNVPLFYDAIENLFITALKQMNIDYINPDGKKAVDKILFNNEDAKKVAKKLKEWSEEGLICSRSQMPLDSKGNNIYGTQYYGEGKNMMIILSTANVQYFALDGFVSQAYNYPHYNKNTFGVTNSSNEKYNIISQGPSLVFFENKDKRVENATFEFYKELVSAENSASLAVATEYFPIKNDSYKSTKITNDKKNKDNKIEISTSIKDKKSQLSGKVMEYNETNTSNNTYFMTKATYYSSTVRSAVKDMLNTILSTIVTSENTIDKIVDSAFETAYKKVVNSVNLDD